MRNWNKSSCVLCPSKIRGARLILLSVQEHVFQRDRHYTCNFAVSLRAHAKLHFSPWPMFPSSPDYFLRDPTPLFPVFPSFSETCIIPPSWMRRGDGGKCEWAGPERNFNQLFAYTRRVAYFRHGRWANHGWPASYALAPRCIFHGTDVGKGRETMELCGLWIIHRWRMDAGVQSAWLVSAVSARPDSADEQIFYKRAVNWHAPDSHFRGSAGISRRRLIVARAADFAARRIFLPKFSFRIHDCISVTY